MGQIKEFFEENGYYHARSVFSSNELAAMVKDYDYIVEQLQQSDEVVDGTWEGSEIEKLQNKNSTIIHTHNVQQYSAVWLHAIQQERFLHIAQEILGENVILHHSKLFCKPQEKGSPFPMHQDWSYFPTVKDTMIAGIIHVSDATDEMGCLRIYPGSHKLGRLENTSGQEANSPEVLKPYPIENATIVKAQAGDVLFFHYFTLHGSMPNKSAKTRKTVLVQMHAGDDQMEVGIDHVNEKLVLRGRNLKATRASAGEVRG